MFPVNKRCQEDLPRADPGPWFFSLYHPLGISVCELVGGSLMCARGNTECGKRKSEFVFGKNKLANGKNKFVFVLANMLVLK